jgi:CubicO group peptidase (beta-lactamase class C family)
MMTSNSIGDLYITNSLRYTSGDKFGYGVGIRTARSNFSENESIGSYGWDGALYTRFWVDPREDMIGVFMSQMDNFWSENYIGKYKTLVYQSIID